MRVRETLSTEINYRDNQATVTLLKLCRNLRQSSTPTEAMLWRVLRNRQVAGAKFRRQHQFGPYILDFYCHEAHIAVELDGDTHTLPGREAIDETRAAYLESRGVQVLRFTNREVLESLEGVALAIWSALEPSPSLSQRERDLSVALPIDLA